MISWMIRPPCEITDQLAVGTQNCFSTLFYTPYILTLKIKRPECTKMHHCQTKKSKKFLGEGARPSPQAPLPIGRVIPPPQTPPLSAPSATRFSRLRRLAFPFLFIRSTTSESRPNSIEGKNVRPYVRPYVRPSTKSFFNLNEIWYIGRGR